jgi:SAM-dependent methyltransferase
MDDPAQPRLFGHRAMVARSGCWQFPVSGFSQSVQDEAPPPPALKQHDARAVCPVVQTDQNLWSVITSMIDIGPEDVVLDIGCGDGRLLAHAARTCRCRCIGLDVRESCLENTREAAIGSNVGHLVEAFDQDFLDLASLERFVQTATVVYAYLLPHLVRKIEPVLLRAVEAGKRVMLFCSSGSRVRRHDAPASGNALGELIPAKQVWFGRLRLYFNRHAAASDSAELATPSAPAAPIAAIAAITPTMAHTQLRELRRPLPASTALPPLVARLPLPLPLPSSHAAALSRLEPVSAAGGIKASSSNPGLPTVGSKSRLRVGSKSRLPQAPLPALVPIMHDPALLVR